MPSIASLRLTDVITLGAALRALGSKGGPLEDAANQMVAYLYDAFMEKTGERSCALVRFYVTQRYEDLSADLQAFAASLLGDRAPAPDTCCLVLVATRGIEPAWCSRRTSASHRAIPLPDDAFVARLPMIAEMFRQFGLKRDALLRPTAELVREFERRLCSAFVVPEAGGSAFIPAQDFVHAYRIRSAAAFGGMLPGGELFATILFSQVPVSPEAAEMLVPLSLSVKLGILSYSGDKIFS